jgi:hypothetical protein
MASLPMMNAFGFAPFWNNANFDQFLANFLNHAQQTVNNGAKNIQKPAPPKPAKTMPELQAQSLFPTSKSPTNSVKSSRSSSNTVSS